MISRNVINSRSGILFIIMMNVSHLLDISLKHVNSWEVLKFYWAKTVMLVTNPPPTYNGVIQYRYRNRYCRTLAGFLNGRIINASGCGPPDARRLCNLLGRDLIATF